MGKICMNCKFINTNVSQYCRKCGAKLEVVCNDSSCIEDYDETSSNHYGSNDIGISVENSTACHYYKEIKQQGNIDNEDIKEEIIELSAEENKKVINGRGNFDGISKKYIYIGCILAFITIICISNSLRQNSTRSLENEISKDSNKTVTNTSPIQQTAKEDPSSRNNIKENDTITSSETNKTDNITRTYSKLPTSTYGIDYMVPDSSIRRLTEEELVNAEIWQLALARNEIFARRGYVFNNPQYNLYFSSKSWYRSDKNFKVNFNEVERYNVNLIQRIENDKKGQLDSKRLISAKEALDILVKSKNLKIIEPIDLNRIEASDTYGENFYGFTYAYFSEEEGDSVILVSQVTRKIYTYDVMGDITLIHTDNEIVNFTQ